MTVVTICTKPALLDLQSSQGRRGGDTLDLDLLVAVLDQHLTSSA